MINRQFARAAWLLGLSALWAASAAAQAKHDHSAMGQAGMGPSAAPAKRSGSAAMTEGQVKKVDVQATTITLQHGPIKNLDMPGMTMAFQVKSAALLDKVKAGDKVRFSAEMPGGVLTISAIEVLK